MGVKALTPDTTAVVDVFWVVGRFIWVFRLVVSVIEFKRKPPGQGAETKRDLPDALVLV